jgi:hypothetical protein
VSQSEILKDKNVVPQVVYVNTKRQHEEKHKYPKLELIIVFRYGNPMII